MLSTLTMLKSSMEKSFSSFGILTAGSQNHNHSSSTKNNIHINETLGETACFKDAAQRTQSGY